MQGDLDPDRVESRALLAAADFDGARVLEVGCGDGRLAFRYASAPAFVLGIDPSLEQVQSALAACPSELRPRISFGQANALALPVRDRSFDIAVLAWSL